MLFRIPRAKTEPNFQYKTVHLKILTALRIEIVGLAAKPHENANHCCTNIRGSQIAKKSDRVWLASVEELFLPAYRRYSGVKVFACVPVPSLFRCVCVSKWRF